MRWEGDLWALMMRLAMYDILRMTTNIVTTFASMLIFLSLLTVEDPALVVAYNHCAFIPAVDSELF